MMTKMTAALLALCMLLLSGAAACAQEEFYDEMPYYLQFAQQMQTEEVAEDVFVQRIYPHTASDAVNSEMRGLIDVMTERNRANLPLNQVTIPSYLDVGAVISRSGTSVLSFLTLAEVSREKEQLSVDFETRVYDIETGKRLTLCDLFPEDSGAWALLAREIREQLSAAFPSLEPDVQALERLCSIDGVKNASFTLGAARLTLSYRADTLYPGKNTLLHVNVYYPAIREMMTDYAKAQTDNSRFKMVALTYDDGGARGSTRRVLNELRNYGAQATFFIVGEMIRNNHDNVMRQQDGNYSIQSHTYTHRYPKDLTEKEIFAEKQRMNDELGDLAGVVPTMMRAPGGQAVYYANRDIGYPLLQWSLASGDSGNPHVKRIAEKVIGGAGDGDVVLMHDLNTGCAAYTAEILASFSRRGILCVTVEELFADAGVPLEKNLIYKDPYRLEE